MVRSRTESSRVTIRGDLMRITRVPAPVVVIALVACSGQRAATGTGAAEWPVGATPIITIGATEADPGEELAGHRCAMGWGPDHHREQRLARAARLRFGREVPGRGRPEGPGPGGVRGGDLSLPGGRRLAL